MPDTFEAVPITAGSGTNVATDKVTQSGTDYYLQVVKVGLGADGANDGFVSATNPLPVDSAASAVTLYNVTLTNNNTEYSQALPNPCRRLAFQCRTSKDVRFAFVTGKVATSVAPYYTLKSNTTYDSGPIHLASGTIYFASGTGGVVMEVEAWG